MGGNVDRAGWKEDHGTEKGEYRRDMMRLLDFVCLLSATTPQQRDDLETLTTSFFSPSSHHHIPHFADLSLKTPLLPKQTYTTPSSGAKRAHSLD